MSLQLKPELIEEVKHKAKYINGRGKLKNWYAQIESSESYLCSEGTAKRFLKGQPVEATTFIRLCENLEYPWQDCSLASEYTPKLETRNADFIKEESKISRLQSQECYKKARLETVCGKTESAISTFQTLLSKSNTKAERVHIVGQITNVEFIALQRAQLNDLSTLQEMNDVVTEALGEVGLPSVKLDLRVLWTPEIQERLFSGDIFDKLYLILFSAMLTSESALETNELRNLLLLQLKVIRSILKVSPQVGWNRFSPLIAQAIRLKDIEFAEMAWKEAHTYETHHFRSVFNIKASEYVRLQKEESGIEWRIHKYLRICILILKGDYESASRNLSLLYQKLPLDAEPYFVDAVDALFDILRLVHTKSLDFFLGRKLPNLSSHNTYLNLL